MMKSKCCHIGGGCSCGLFHSQGISTNSFSMLFSMPVPTAVDHHDSSMDDYNYYDSSPDHHRSSNNYMNDYYYTNNHSSSSSSSPPSPGLVDCTLSLATPSAATTPPPARRRPPPSPAAAPWSSSFCWDILHSSAAPAALPNPKTCTATRPSPTLLDPLLARRCANCDTTSTPLWRNGPRGPKSLCNACGIRFKKEERRANAAAATATNGGGGGGDGMGQQQQHHISNPWLHHQFRFIDDVVEDRDSPFLSWRLNVTDRPTLVHDFST